MNSIMNIAQSGVGPEEYSTKPSEISLETVAAVYGVFLVFVLAIYIVRSLLRAKIFGKAGIARWKAWIPVYSTWKMLQIGGQEGYWAVFSVLPLFNIVTSIFLYISMYHIGLKLGKQNTFVLLALFVPTVWYFWLALDGSKWNESLSSAPSQTRLPNTPTV
jgi:hypothetical protein